MLTNRLGDGRAERNALPARVCTSLSVSAKADTQRRAPRHPPEASLPLPHVLLRSTIARELLLIPTRLRTKRGKWAVLTGLNEDCWRIA